jgi:hypothetical protein
LRAALALRLLQRKDVEVIHLGKALDLGLGKQARRLMRGDKRYRCSARWRTSARCAGSLRATP